MIKLQSTGTYFGKPIVLACDGQCHKAWGIMDRPQVYLSCNEDDYAYLADGELGYAPADPGSYEGPDAKPLDLPERHNKWCARACERCYMGDPDKPIVLWDLSQRTYNYHNRQHDPSLIDYTARGEGIGYGDEPITFVWHIAAPDADEAMVIAQWLLDLYLKPGASLILIRAIVLEDAS